MPEARLTKRQAAIIGLYTGYTAGPFGDVHELAEELLGVAVGPVTMAVMKDRLRELARPLFLETCYEGEQADGPV